MIIKIILPIEIHYNSWKILMIPKKIHYIWLGGNPLPPLAKQCIQTWHKMLPDFEIIEWNENSINIQDSAYRKAYKNKKWAFCSDLARLKILLEHGGVYLDVDMEVIKDLSSLLDVDFFIGYENRTTISAGIIGCVANNAFVKDCYEEVLESLKTQIYTPIPKIITKIYNKNSLTYSFNHRLYSPEFFYPYHPFESGIRTMMYKDITENTHAIHHWNFSWQPTLFEKILKVIYTNIISIKKIFFRK